MKKALRFVQVISVAIALMLLLTLFVCIFVIHPVPSINNNNVITEYHPWFSQAYSLNIDTNNNFYIQTQSCTLCFDSNWQYIQSYMFRRERMSEYVLTVTDDALLYEQNNSAYIGRISFSGKYTESSNYHHNKKHCRYVYTLEGKTYCLKANSFFARVIDNEKRTVWHSSIVGGLILLGIRICFPLFLLSTFIYIIKYGSNFVPTQHYSVSKVFRTIRTIRKRVK